MQAISFIARRGAGMAEHGLFLESSEASSFLALGNQDISINMARHSVAGYVRSGNDLILNLSDGREIVL
ncbi:MAG: BapA prefix-like domain-containing protein [Paracoccaceae bacterium]